MGLRALGFALLAASLAVLSSCATAESYGDEVSGCKFGFCIGSSNADVVAELDRHHQRYAHNTGKQCLGVDFGAETDMINTYDANIVRTRTLCLTFSGDRLTHIVWTISLFDVGL